MSGTSCTYRVAAPKSPTGWPIRPGASSGRSRGCCAAANEGARMHRQMSDDAAATSLRTHRAGALRVSDTGATVRLGGWVHRTRDLGGLVFIDLRDRDGLVQVSVGPEHAAAAGVATATTLRAGTGIR